MSWIVAAAAGAAKVVKGRKAKKSGKAQEKELRQAEQEADQSAQRIAAENARMVRQESDESFRRMDREQEFRMGSARAQIGTSGVMGGSGSAKVGLEAIEGEFLKQRQHATDIADHRERMALEGAEGAGQQFGTAADQVKYSSQAASSGYMLGAVGDFAQAWWG